MDEARGVCPCAFLVREFALCDSDILRNVSACVRGGRLASRSRVGDLGKRVGSGGRAAPAAGCGRVMRRPLDTFRKKREPRGRETRAGCGRAVAGAADLRLPGPWTCGCKGGAAAGAADRSCRGCGARGRRGRGARGRRGRGARGRRGRGARRRQSGSGRPPFRPKRAGAKTGSFRGAGPRLPEAPRKGRTAKGSDPPQKKGRCRVGSRREDAARRPRF